MDKEIRGFFSASRNSKAQEAHRIYGTAGYTHLSLRHHGIFSEENAGIKWKNSLYSLFRYNIIRNGI